MSEAGLLIVKVGGGAALNLPGVAADLAAHTGPVIVIHGANALRDELALALGKPTRVVTSVSGYSSVLSDDDAIDLLMLAYAGLQNKRLVELLQRAGRNAVGLTGLDGRLVEGARNRGVRVREGGKTLLLRDRSGKPARVNGDLIRLLLGNGYTPVMTVPIADEEGIAINSENDDVLALVQRTLRATHVVELMEAPGLLRDPGDPASLVPRLDAAELLAWEERADGRFKRKLHAMRRMFEETELPPVLVLGDGRREHPVADALAGHGTLITAAGRGGGA